MRPPLLSDELAKLLGSSLVGEVRAVSRLSPPQAATLDAAVVLFGAKLKAFPEAALLIVPESTQLSAATPHIIVADPKVALAQLSEVFDTRMPVAEGIHESAQIDTNAVLGNSVHIGANAVVAAEVVLGDNVRVGAGCVLSKGVKVGANSILHPNVTLYEGTVLGERVVLHSGVVVGADGFGYAATKRGALKIHHLGGVVLDDDVEIGANSCVDRATLGNTRIGARTKLDNLCQIGHNVIIGTDCFIAGTSAIAGSTTLGNRVVVGGSVGIIDHLTIGDDAQLGARALVTKNVPERGRWLGNPAQPQRDYVRQRGLLKRLESLLNRLEAD